MREALSHKGVVCATVMLLAVLSYSVPFLSIPSAMLMACVVIGKFQPLSAVMAAAMLPSCMITAISGVPTVGCSVEFAVLMLMAVLYNHCAHWVDSMEYVSIASFLVQALVYHRQGAWLAQVVKDADLGVSADVLMALLVTKFQVVSLLLLFFSARWVARWYGVSTSFYKSFVPCQVHALYAGGCVGAVLLLTALQQPLSIACPLAVPFLYVGHVAVRDYIIAVAPDAWSQKYKKLLYYMVLVTMVLKDFLLVFGVIFYMLLGVYRSLKSYRQAQELSS